MRKFKLKCHDKCIKTEKDTSNIFKAKTTLLNLHITYVDLNFLHFSNNSFKNDIELIHICSLILYDAWKTLILLLRSEYF